MTNSWELNFKKNGRGMRVVLENSGDEAITLRGAKIRQWHLDP